MKRTLKYGAVAGGIAAILLASVVAWMAHNFLLPLTSVEEDGRKAIEEAGRVLAAAPSATDADVGAEYDFFPPGALDEFRATWYSGHMNALQEHSLWQASKRSLAETYRFTWLRTFHHPIVVRVDVRPDGTCVLTTKVSSGAGGYSPGKLIENRTQELTRQQSGWILEQISALRFWEVSGGGEALGVDGAQWILEGAKGGRYKLVDVWSPEDGAVRKLGLLMVLDLSSLSIPKDEVY